MFRKVLIVIGLAMLGIMSAPSGPASAFDEWRHCRHAYGYDCDPYAYNYRPPGYYPYYNSGQWRPAWAYRRPRYGFRHPPYYQAWGYPRRYGLARAWHSRRYRGHRHHGRRHHARRHRW